MGDKQMASAAIAEMLEQARQLVFAAREMGNESGIDVSFEGFYEEISGNRNVDWNSSFC